MSKFTSSTKWAKAYLINYISISCRKVWVIPSFFAVCHRLNDKGLHDFEKRMIISKLLGGGGVQPPPPAPPGCYGPVKYNISARTFDNFAAIMSISFKLFSFKMF